MVHVLQNAMESKSLLEMIYISSSGEISQRILTVCAITEHHVRAFCHLRNQTRVFKIENILSVLPHKQKRKFIS